MHEVPKIMLPKPKRYIEFPHSVQVDGELQALQLTVVHTCFEELDALTSSFNDMTSTIITAAQ